MFCKAMAILADCNVSPELGIKYVGKKIFHSDIILF